MVRLTTNRSWKIAASAGRERAGTASEEPEAACRPLNSRHNKHSVRRRQPQQTTAPPPRSGSARTLQNLSITQCDALWKLGASGRWRTLPPALDGAVHASAACAWARRPGRRQGSRHLAWRGASAWTRASTCTDRARRGLLPDHVRRRAGPEFRSRSSRPRGISALSTETMCGPRLRPPRCPPPPSRHKGARIVTGQWRWRWDLNPRKTCSFTRFRVLREAPDVAPALSFY